MVKCKVAIKDKNQKTKAWCLGLSFHSFGFQTVPPFINRLCPGDADHLRPAWDNFKLSFFSQDGQLIFALESKARLLQGSRCHPTAGDVTTFSCKNVVHEFGFQLQGGDCESWVGSREPSILDSNLVIGQILTFSVKACESVSPAGVEMVSPGGC